MTPKFKTRDVEKSLYANYLKRASESHNEAAALFKTIKADDEETNTNANRISRILSIKNMAEYEDRLVLKTEAEKVIKDCERFLEYVKTKLPK